MTRSNIYFKHQVFNILLKVLETENKGFYKVARVSPKTGQVMYTEKNLHRDLEFYYNQVRVVKVDYEKVIIVKS